MFQARIKGQRIALKQVELLFADPHDHLAIQDQNELFLGVQRMMFGPGMPPGRSSLMIEAN